MLAHDRRGSGPPLLLVHGLGSRRAAWGPLTDRLSRDHEVVAVDLPGFGESPPLAEPPTAAALAAAVGGTLDDLGWRDAHVVGHSLGGWVALELARAGRARAVCALTPAGLWPSGQPAHARVLLRGSHLAARLAAPLLAAVPGDRSAELRDFAAAPGWVPTYEAIKHDRFDGGGDIAVPVTVLLGRLDPLIRPEQVRRDALPAGTRWVVWTACGHLPMLEHPHRTERLIRHAVGSD